MLSQKLKYTIQILKTDSILDDYNGRKEVDSILYNALKSSVKYVSSDLFDGEFKQIKNYQKIEFNIRYKKDINVDCKVVFKGETYKIIGVDVIERNKELKLSTTKL